MRSSRHLTPPVPPVAFLPRPWLRQGRRTGRRIVLQAPEDMQVTAVPAVHHLDTSCRSPSVAVAGTRTLRHIGGRMPCSETFSWTTWLIERGAPDAANSVIARTSSPAPGCPGGPHDGQLIVQTVPGHDVAHAAERLIRALVLQRGGGRFRREPTPVRLVEFGPQVKAGQHGPCVGPPHGAVVSSRHAGRALSPSRSATLTARKRCSGDICRAAGRMSRAAWRGRVRPATPRRHATAALRRRTGRTR